VEFVDTNILIYANDRSAGRKRDLASSLLVRLTETDEGAMSIQVLTEFYEAVTRKHIVPDPDAMQIMWDYSHWTLHHPGIEHLMDAAELRSRYRLSWFDALILNSALQLGCTTLWTEDFSHGQKFGELTIRNPFTA
jgi:predicted nucleic acid-binding protein